MASYFTQFSCVLPIGSAANLQAALCIYQTFAADKAVAGEELGFTAKADPPSDDLEDNKVWLYSDEAGEPEDVIAYVLQCAKGLGLTGIWGFRWSLSCSRPLLDGHGGGAHVLDLGTGQTIDWIDLDHWLVEQADAYLLAKAEQGFLAAPTPPPAPSARSDVLAGQRVLDVSGGHLRPTTWAWLDDQTADDVVRDPANHAYAILGGRTRQGWFLRADEVLDSTVPSDLADMLRYVRQSGCSFVTVDCDCIPLADLPILHPEFQDTRTSV